MAFSMITKKASGLVQRLLFLSLLSRPSSSLLTSRSNIFAAGVRVSSLLGRPFTGNRAFLSSTSSDVPEIKHIGKEKMQELIENYENVGREKSLCVVIDVRTEEEVYSTGKLSPSVHTLPVQVIMQANVFQMDPDEFEDFCGFEKPKPDETVVFSCAAGIRSVYACNFASQAGYSKLVNYAGGSNEWFSPF
jgi:rhodanese-related sulfurtransferase